MKSNRKILCIIDQLGVGGAEQVFSDIAELMEGYPGLEVLLILPPGKDAYHLPPAVQVHYLNRKHRFSIRAFLDCARLLRKFDLLHVHMRHNYRYIALINKLFFINKRIILHDHSGLIRIDRGLPFRFSRWFKPSVYIGVSGELSEWAISKWKLNPEIVHTFINLPSKRFLEQNNPKSMEHHDRALVMVGNIKAVKNQTFAVNIARQLCLPIVLIGKNQDTEYFLSIKNSSDKGDILILDRIEDVSSELGKYWLGLYTSISESGPLVILEYLLCGLPFLAFRTGGTAEAIFKYFPHFFMDNFNVSQWCERILEWKENPPSIDRARVEEMLVKEFNRDIYRERLKKLYEA
jgi:glycosyltransferase involved in cell wall biosynthesis